MNSFPRFNNKNNSMAFSPTVGVAAAAAAGAAVALSVHPGLQLGFGLLGSEGGKDATGGSSDLQSGDGAWCHLADDSDLVDGGGAGAAFRPGEAGDDFEANAGIFGRRKKTIQNTLPTLEILTAVEAPTTPSPRTATPPSPRTGDTIPLVALAKSPSSSSMKSMKRSPSIPTEMAPPPPTGASFDNLNGTYCTPISCKRAMKSMKRSPSIPTEMAPPPPTGASFDNLNDTYCTPISCKRASPTSPPASPQGIAKNASFDGNGIYANVSNDGNYVEPVNRLGRPKKLGVRRYEQPFATNGCRGGEKPFAFKFVKTTALLPSPKSKSLPTEHPAAFVKSLQDAKTRAADAAKFKKQEQMAAYQRSLSTATTSSGYASAYNTDDDEDYATIPADRQQGSKSSEATQKAKKTRKSILPWKNKSSDSSSPKEPKKDGKFKKRNAGGTRPEIVIISARPACPCPDSAQAFDYVDGVSPFLQQAAQKSAGIDTRPPLPPPRNSPSNTAAPVKRKSRKRTSDLLQHSIFKDASASASAAKMRRKIRTVNTQKAYKEKVEARNAQIRRSAASSKNVVFFDTAAITWLPKEQPLPITWLPKEQPLPKPKRGRSSSIFTCCFRGESKD